MNAQTTNYATYGDGLSRAAELRRYVAAALIVVVVCGAVVLALSHGSADTAASEVDNAVLVDLPPAEASSQPASEAPEGPEQQAMQAVPAQPAPPKAEPPPQLQPPPDRPDTPPSPEPIQMPELPPQPAVLERMQAQVVPPQPAVALPVPPQDERAPTGSELPTASKKEDSDSGQPHASAHAITLWQRSLMRRLESAKRALGSERHAVGTVRVEFAINATGGLAFERVIASSGSVALDRAAIVLVKDAAPFPAPPAGSDPKSTSFIVPIRFR